MKFQTLGLPGTHSQDLMACQSCLNTIGSLHGVQLTEFQRVNRLSPRGELLACKLWCQSHLVDVKLGLVG